MQPNPMAEPAAQLPNLSFLWKLHQFLFSTFPCRGVYSSHKSFYIPPIHRVNFFTSLFPVKGKIPTTAGFTNSILENILLRQHREENHEIPLEFHHKSHDIW